MRKLEARHETEDRNRVSRMHATPVSEVMRRDVICVPEDLSEGALMGILLENDLPGAPVVDAAGYLVGYVSMSDILRERYENADTSETVRVANEGERLGNGFHLEILPPTVAEIMSQVAVELLDTSHLDTAASLMAARRVNHLPVVDQEGHVVGILHAHDVLRWLADPRPPLVH